MTAPVDLLIVANLDCELEWATAPPLPAPVRAMLAGLGTLMRVLAHSDGDAIELVTAIDPRRISAVAGVARPTLVARGGHAVTGREVITWGATAAHDGDVAAARRGNDRRLAHRIERTLDAAPSRTRVVDSVATLEAHLPALVTASPTATWIAKATLCAAGRDRVRRRGAALDDATRVRLERLLARSDGALVVEPWLDRIVDLGQPGRVDADRGVTLTPPHRLLCDPGGGFRGITIGRFDSAHLEALAAAGRAAGAALGEVGYRGPFVVDAFVHRDRGAEVLRPMVEINARLTFGWLARAWAERLGDGTLELGRGAPPAGAVPLLLPDDGDPTSAWFMPLLPPRSSVAAR